MTERKAFNFYKSYFDIFNELICDKDKVKFIEALLNRQFYGIEPELDGMPKFAYISQKHSIDAQVIGFEKGKGLKLTPPMGGVGVTPLEEVQVQVEEKGQVKGKVVLLLSQVDKSTLDHKTSTYYDIAISFMELFKSNLLELNISTKTLEAAKFKKWVDPIRLLIENDNKTIEEFREVWQFLKDDEFWKQQIRSTSKLRKKDKDGIIYFEVLLIKSRNEQKRKSTSEKSNSGVTDAYKQSIYDRLHGIKSNEEVPQN